MIGQHKDPDVPVFRPEAFQNSPHQVFVKIFYRPDFMLNVAFMPGFVASFDM